MISATVLELPAAPRARGRAHGEAARGLIREHVAVWLSHVDGGRAVDPRAYLSGFLESTSFLDIVRRQAPVLLEEVEGIAEGAGLPFADIFALQLLDEEWAYAARRRSQATIRDKCSSFAIPSRDGAATLIGQNMDLGQYTDGFQLLIRSPSEPGTPSQQIFTLAGMIALMGVNGTGVGVCVNTLSQLPSAAAGMPVAFVVRLALACRTASVAADSVAGLRHASGQHYVIADAEHVVSLECSSQSVERPDCGTTGHVLHTNHPLAPALARNEAAYNGINSPARLASLRTRLGCGPVGIDTAKAALRSFDDAAHPVCRLGGAGGGLIGFTTGSMISTLPRAPRPVVSEVAFGPPSERPYRSFTLDP